MIQFLRNRQLAGSDDGVTELGTMARTSIPFGLGTNRRNGVTMEVVARGMAAP